MQGSDEAVRLAIAAAVKTDPLWADKGADLQAEETENRFQIAKGVLTDPDSRMTQATAIAAGKLPALSVNRDSPDAAKTMALVFKIKPDYDGGDYARNNSPMGARNEVYFKRIATAATEASQAAANIMELPASSSSGIFAGRGQSPGLMGAAKETLANALTSQDVQSYNSMVPGISRSLSTIEASGLAPPGSFTSSMDSLTLKEGDSEITKMRKMAEVRQIVEKGMVPSLVDPKIPEVQKDQIRGVIAQIQTAIPFTHHDITMLDRSTTPGQTMSDLVAAKGLGGNGTASSPANNRPPLSSFMLQQ